MMKAAFSTDGITITQSALSSRRLRNIIGDVDNFLHHLAGILKPVLVFTSGPRAVRIYKWSGGQSVQVQETKKEYFSSNPPMNILHHMSFASQSATLLHMRQVDSGRAISERSLSSFSPAMISFPAYNRLEVVARHADAGADGSRNRLRRDLAAAQISCAASRGISNRFE